MYAQKLSVFFPLLLSLDAIALQPNVLFILADDQRADALGASGNTYIKTPNIDMIASEGIRFSNAYIMGGHHGAISAPSRAMLLSGKGLFHVYAELTGVTTMPMHFNKHGYETFGTGKWHNKANNFEAAFQKGKNVYLGGMSDHFKVPCQDLGPDGKLGKPIYKSYSTDIFAGSAIEFIKEYSRGKRNNPFFCYVAFTAPHDPRSPREDYIGMYRDESMPLPGNFCKFHPFRFDSMTIRDEHLVPWPRTPEMIRASLADYYAMISHMDSKIGEIVRLLKEQGLFENTIIVYAADNGLAIGSHGLLGKQNLYEHSMKVPLIMSGPGIPKGKVSEAMVYLYDVFPTLSKLCGFEPPEGIDGMDMMPVITGQRSTFRESIFTAYRNLVRAIREDEWKLIYYINENYPQLFNLREDPLEINNLATLPGYKDKVEELMIKLRKSLVEAGDTASLTVRNILPLYYNPSGFIQQPDEFQPEYILKKYFTKSTPPLHDPMKKQ